MTCCCEGGVGRDDPNMAGFPSLPPSFLGTQGELKSLPLGVARESGSGLRAYHPCESVGVKGVEWE